MYFQWSKIMRTAGAWANYDSVSEAGHFEQIAMVLLAEYEVLSL